MRRRVRQIGLLAILAVLLHAGALVRHHVGMVSSHFAHASLVASLGVICHPSGDAGVADTGQLPDVPKPGLGGECPLCSAGCSAVAVLAEPVVPVFAHVVVSERIEVIAEFLAGHLTDLRPPVRGPPLNG